MCGRYTLHPDPGLLEKAYRLESPVDVRPRWNIAPGTQVPAVLTEPGRPAATLVPMHWGFRIQTAGESPRMVINARLESVQSRPLFRNAFSGRRCILPASGFYEWTDNGTHRARYPSWIHPAPPGQLFHFAALWRDEEGGPSVVILTEAADGPVARLHHRMPVFLDPGTIREWLDPTKVPTPETLPRIPVNDQTVRVHPVSTAVNSTTNDSASLIEPTPAPPLQVEFDW